MSDTVKLDICFFMFKNILERKKKYTDRNRASLLQYALCINLVEKWAQIADRGKNILSFYAIFHYSTSNSRLIIELRINLSSVHP